MSKYKNRYEIENLKKTWKMNILYAVWRKVETLFITILEIITFSCN